MTRKKLLKRFREIGLIHKEPVRLRSGAISPYYCDIKKAYGYPDLLSALAEEISKRLPTGTTCVAASGYGGIPLAALVASVSKKKFTAVRDTPKRHGKGGKIDGYIPSKKDSIVIVDDVLTTGSSVKETFSALKKISGRVSSAIVVVKRGEPKLPVPYSSIFSITELLE